MEARYNSIKNYFVNNFSKIQRSKEMVNSLDTNYFTHDKINYKDNITDYISIVMTTCNRSKQTYFTLDSFSKSQFKNIQVVIVDDSSDDPILVNHLNKYDFRIDLIKIKNKFWFNPCVNYNFGFKFVEGTKMIIQNAEVCHIGDVINFVETNLQEGQYLVFDVVSLKNNSVNDKLYSLKEEELNSDVLKNFNNGQMSWYQHVKYRNQMYHFLTAITKKDFDEKMHGGFDYDFCLGGAYDDNEFIHRIVHVAKLNPINVSENAFKLFGIHQWHKNSTQGVTWAYNEFLFHAKVRCGQKGNYIYLVDEKPEEIPKIFDTYFK